MRKILLAVIISATLAGCTTVGYLEPVEGEKQRIVYEDGKAVVYSKKANLVAVALPSSVESMERFRMYVQVGNGSQDSFNFSPTYVMATDAVGTPISQRLHVWTYDELVAEQKRKEMWMAVAVALSAVGNSMAASNAGYSRTYGSYSGTSSGNIYGTSYSTYGNNYGFNASHSGTYSSYTYDGYKAYMAQEVANAKNERMMQNLMANSQAAMYELSKNILKTNTVDPGGICGGLVAIDGPRVHDQPTYMEIEVEAGEEIHTFKYRVRKAQ